MQLAGSQFLTQGLNPGAMAVNMPNGNHWTARELPSPSILILRRASRSESM